MENSDQETLKVLEIKQLEKEINNDYDELIGESLGAGFLSLMLISLGIVAKGIVKVPIYGMMIAYLVYAFKEDILPIKERINNKKKKLVSLHKS